MHRKHDCEYLELNTVPTDKQQPVMASYVKAFDFEICARPAA